MKGIPIEDLEIGDKASFSKTLSETDVYLFAGITGDFNPAHVNEIEARGSIFEGRVAHGMLVAGFLSTVVGMQLPGPGSILVRQELKFLSPVRIGDTVTAEVEVLEIHLRRNMVILGAIIKNQDCRKVIQGKAVVKPPLKCSVE
ncbi:MAG: MaoC family dehydratase [Synergistales bacterium]|nr:MaoC family dehydratase [Synergistales bacterium]